MIENELQILSYIEDDHVHHSNINRLNFAFHDSFSLYLAFDLKISGDLRYHLQKKKTFVERDVAFIAICMADALNHLHARGIIHRKFNLEIEPNIDICVFYYLLRMQLFAMHPAHSISFTQYKLISNDYYVDYR
jgi:serine/threonine protein kinase